MNKFLNLPESWEIKTLGEVCEKISAGGDRPDDCTQEKTKENQIPVFSNGVENNGLYGYTKTPTITKPALTISARGTIGFVCVRYKPFFPIVRLICAIPNDKILSLEFLSYALQYIIPQGEGSTIPQLTIPNFKQIKIPVPPIEVQKEIASRLDFSFDKIDKALKLLNQNKEHIKKYRLSLLKYAFDGKLTPSSKNWEAKTLNDVCIPSSSNIAFKEVKDKKGDYPIYGASGIVAYADFYSKEKECIGIVKDGSVGKIFLLPAKSSVISTLNYLENTDNLDIKYLYYFLQRINFVKYIKGSVIPHIYFRDYKKEKIPVPPLEVQKEIVSILDNEFEVMEKVEKLNNENIENLLLLKKSLLKEAFSGEREY